MSHGGAMTLKPLEQPMNKHNSLFVGQTMRKRKFKIWTNLTEIASNVSTAHLDGFLHNG
jgi:hypothetical protein